MKTGIKLIADERRRQIHEEKWTAEHDDSHINGELAVAAACYLRGSKSSGTIRTSEGLSYFEKHVPGSMWYVIKWPWDAGSWKPTPNRVRNLVKAAALIVAEIDRLQRLREKRKKTA